MATVSGQVCKRIFWYSCTFACKLHDRVCAIVLSVLLFGVCTFTCVVCLIFWLVIAKSVMHFFALLYFGVFQIVCTCVHAIVCVLGWLVLLIFSIMHIYSCLSHFLQSFSQPLHCFLWANFSHLYFFVFSQVFADPTSSSFVVFCRSVSRFTISEVCAHYPFTFHSPFVLVAGILLFFDCFCDTNCFCDFW